MAEDAVDEAVRTFNLQPKPTTLPDISGAGLAGLAVDGSCCTLTTPLIGAHGFSPALPSQLTQVHGVEADIAAHLASNYGDRAWAVLSTPGADTRLLRDFPFVEAELRHGIRAEAGCTATDLIARRTRLAFLDVDSALKVLPRVIDVMAEELSWDEARKQHEWTETVHFFHSMGLPQDKLGLTREEVSGSVKASQSSRSVSPAPSMVGDGGIKVGGGGLQGLGNGTIAARTSNH